MAVKKNIQPTRSDLIDKYADYCLMNGHKPASVYKFSKDNGFDEAEFYKSFASFEALEHYYFVEMFNYTLQALQQSPAYEGYGGVEKMSAFYFTFFEMATANRSFITYLMQESGLGLKNLMKLRSLRSEFIQFAEAVLEKPMTIEHPRTDKIQGQALREGAWVQFLSIFKFWLQDKSPGFEKTDIFIEKSVKASSDLVYNSPLQSLLDLGKFVWKEKFTV